MRRHGRDYVSDHLYFIRLTSPHGGLRCTAYCEHIPSVYEYCVNLLRRLSRRISSIFFDLPMNIQNRIDASFRWRY